MVLEKYFFSSEYNFLEIINSNPDKPWTQSISSNQHLTWEFIQANPNKPWCWANIVCHIPWKIIEANPNYPWDDQEWFYISVNRNITLKIVKSNPNINEVGMGRYFSPSEHNLE